MTIQQLQYLVEIERTRSISQAAQNLYIGQPNLSRILKDTENHLGFPIFERTRKGVRPTERGVLFLQHARNILREQEFIESLGPNAVDPGRFRICLPRSYTYLELTNRYLHELNPEFALDAYIRECHPRQALNYLESGSVEIAIIRYSVDYEDYFSEQFAARSVKALMLDTTCYAPIMSDTCPLAQNTSIQKSQLKSFTEILHRDTFLPDQKGKKAEKKIYTVDRLAQFQLLQSIPNSYLWSEPLPTDFLAEYHLIQLPCPDSTIRYQNSLVYKPQCSMSDIERSYIRWIKDSLNIYQS